MELLLIRHGLPVRVENTDAPADPELAEAGRIQAEALARWLAPAGLTALGSSPMRRAIETARPLAEATGLPAPVFDGLAEMDRDARYYVPMEELKGTNDPRWAEVMAFWTSPEAAQMRKVFADEVVETVESVVRANPGGRVAARVPRRRGQRLPVPRPGARPAVRRAALHEHQPRARALRRPPPDRQRQRDPAPPASMERVS